MFVYNTVICLFFFRFSLWDLLNNNVHLFVNEGSKKTEEREGSKKSTV